MTITDRFSRLLAQIAPSEREESDYASHRSGVARAIAELYPGAKCVPIGSHARGSAIGGTSDLDLLAQLPNDALRWGGSPILSSTALENVRQRLRSRYPTTGIDRDGQAIVVGFAGGARDIDVVPAAWIEMINVAPLRAMRPSYDIPDGAGGWMTTAPQAHNDFIALADRQAGGKLKYVARLLRHWRRSRTPHVPMLTFHAELVLANEGTCNGPRGYGEVLADAFATLARRNGHALRDPLGISGNVPIAATSAKRDVVANALAHAAEHSAKAVTFGSYGQLAAAYDQWSIVFNGDFPSR